MSIEYNNYLYNVILNNENDTKLTSFKISSYKSDNSYLCLLYMIMAINIRL